MVRPAGLSGYGNLGRNALIGPGSKNFDLELHQSFRITEHN